MAVPAVNDKYLITFYGRLCNQIIISTFWYKLTSVGAFTNVLSLYDAINAVLNKAAGLQAKFISCCPDNYSQTETWVQLVKPGRIMKNVYTIAETGGEPEAYTANTSVVIERRGEMAIRAAVGSLHLPAEITDTNFLDGRILDAGTLKPKLTDLAGEMLDSLTGDELGGAILRPIVYNPRNVTWFNGHEVVRCNVQETARVMRRRTVGLGI